MVYEFTIVNMDVKVDYIIQKMNKFVQNITDNIKLLPSLNSNEALRRILKRFQ